MTSKELMDSRLDEAIKTIQEYDRSKIKVVDPLETHVCCFAENEICMVHLVIFPYNPEIPFILCRYLPEYEAEASQFTFETIKEHVGYEPTIIEAISGKATNSNVTMPTMCLLVYNGGKEKAA